MISLDYEVRLSQVAVLDARHFRKAVVRRWGQLDKPREDLVELNDVSTSCGYRDEVMDA